MKSIEDIEEEITCFLNEIYDKFNELDTDTQNYINQHLDQFSDSVYDLLK